MLTRIEMAKVNPHTGLPDELCRECRDPNWDTGVEIDKDTNKVVNWHNEAGNWKFDKPMGGMEGVKSIADHVVNYGSISTEE